MCAFLAETGWTARPSDIAPLSVCRDASRAASCPQARWPGDEVPGFHASWARPSRHAARRQRICFTILRHSGQGDAQKNYFK